MLTTVVADLALDARAEIGECPVWDAAGERILWVDILGRTLLSYQPRTGASARLVLPEQVSAIAMRELGGLVGAAPSGFVFIDENGHHALLSHVATTDDVEGSMPMNDGKCDRAGRFWAGSLALGPHQGRGGLYCLHPGGRVTKALSDVTVSNGLGWSPDDRTMYYIDSATQRVDAFAFDVDSGEMSARRELAEIKPSEGTPDGMTVDSDGCLWVAIVHGGEVRRYSPVGDLIGRIRVPTTVVTSVCFEGADLRDLYITPSATHVPRERRAAEPAAGGLFVCPLPVGGLYQATFKG
jgi:sugar lactone lactonase YvrE